MSRRRSTRLALGFTVALHLGILLASLAPRARPWETDLAPRVLIVQLNGRVSARQVEGSKPDPPSPARPPAATPGRRALPAEPSTVALPVHDTPPARGSAVEPPAPAVAPEPATDAAATADTSAAQSLARREVERDALRRYLANLQQHLQRHLAYPPEARDSDTVGAPVIRFDVDAAGQIASASVALVRSSGHPLLDRQALMAAASSSPLPPPPRAMQVVIAVSFERER